MFTRPNSPYSSFGGCQPTNVVTGMVVYRFVVMMPILPRDGSASSRSGEWDSIAG